MNYAEAVDFGSKHLGNSGTIYVRSVPSGVAMGICIDSNGDLEMAFDATEVGKLIDALRQCQDGRGEESPELCCRNHESEGSVRVTVRRAGDQVELCFVDEQEPDYPWRPPLSARGIQTLERALETARHRAS